MPIHQYMARAYTIKRLLPNMEGRTAAKVGRSLLWMAKGCDSIQPKDLKRHRAPIALV
jgi:hypothetical protein